MADLTKTQLEKWTVTPSKPPFTYVGVDCFGPFTVRRGRTTAKSYCVLFTCLAIRAVHVEVAQSLDTESFIARNFSRSCLTENSSVLFAIGTKLRPLLRTNFSGSDSGKLLGIVITSSWLSLGGSRLLEGPTRLVNFCVLICCRNWKSLELSCLILSRIDSTKTAGQFW